ncbi:carboxypeptidase regulatory-like domain-containing protein, partial [Patescibacteria group bacterium]|nr:carboxypeptidase regulatory-like domain-containing protein [Patescibacteria group bacterium]
IAAYMAKLSVPQPFTWFFTLGIAFIGIALAFIPIEDRGLDEWLVNFIKAINSPTERIWKKETRLPQAFSYNQKLLVVQKELITLAPTTSRRKLEEFLEQENRKTIDDPLDIAEDEYINKVREAFANINTEEPPPQEIQQSTGNLVKEGQSLETATPTKETPKTSEQGSNQKEQMPPKSSEEVQPQQKVDKISKIIKTRMSSAQISLPEDPTRRTTTRLRPVESHAGRKFVNLTPTQGQIILPIRGEKVILPEESEATEEYERKQEQLEKMLERREEFNAKQPKFYKQIPSMVNKPNTVSGVLKNRRGDLLENVVLVIKNEKGETVRALKTNKLGNFMLSSPIPNGNYIIEIDQTRDTGLTFDIISFSANGGLLPSYEVIGH